MPDDDTPKNPLSHLDPREKLDAKLLITELSSALRRAASTGYFDRMQLNMDTRYCLWPDQSDDGRKWEKKNRRLKPGESSEVFPFPGASDVRVRKVHEIATERVGFMKVAYDMVDVRMGPRDMMTDDDLVQKGALWTMAANYYLEDAKRELRRQNSRWVDIAETFGHSLLHVGWRESKQLDKKSITQDQLMVLVSEAAVQVELQTRQLLLQERGLPPEGAALTPEEDQQIRAAAMMMLQDLIEDPKARKILAEELRKFDDKMTVAESLRVAGGLSRKGEALYYVPVVRDSGPVLRALTPYVDVFMPPETTSVKEAQFIAMQEWVSDVTLRERVETEGYDANIVSLVIDKGAGMTFDFIENGSLGKNYEWVISGGTVGGRLVQPEDRSRLWQILHVYYRATSKSGIPVLYHTIVYGDVTDDALKHECCEHAHGQYPFVERMTQPERDTLIASEGIGEISFTDQKEIKTQRDARVDDTSVKMRPPVLVPLNHSGGRLPMRPGAQIPMKMTGGQGKPEFLVPPTDARSSKEIEEVTTDSLDKLWFRGPNVDEVVKQTMRRVMVQDYQSDLEAARKMIWELVQQNCSDRVKAGVINGIPANMEFTREEIQGGVSIQMHFDVNDLDYKMVESKAKMFREVLAPLDPEGLLPTNEVLGVLLAGVAPGWARALQRPQNMAKQKEEDEERRALGDILNGLEPDYVPGKNHTARLQFLTRAAQQPGPDGRPTRVQRILAENPDVMALLQNRLKFHQFQIDETIKNPRIGRLGVEPVNQV